MPEPMSQRDLERAIERLEQAADRMDETYARRDRVERLEKDLESLEGWRDWAVKIVLALVIAAMFAALVAQKAGL